MRKIKIETAIPGQTIAKSIYSSEGKVLLEKGIELSMHHIVILRSFNINELFVEDIYFNKIECDDTVSVNTRLEAKNLVNKIINSNNSNIDSQYKMMGVYVRSIIEPLLIREDIVISLNEIRNVDDYTFEHSVSVCVLSLMIGLSLGYSEEDLLELGIGAMLHDIGKLKIPDFILKKPNHLTPDEFSIIQKHTRFGYEILCESKNFSERSAEVALYHHERIDGSGYPNNLAFSDIPEFARITAVADVFDALTSDRVYRNKLGVKEVVEYMSSTGLNYYDKKMIVNFMKYIAVYPV